MAVKVQHEGVEEIMTSDLKALQRIVNFCVWLGGDQHAETKRLQDLLPGILNQVRRMCGFVAAHATSDVA